MEVFSYIWYGVVGTAAIVGCLFSIIFLLFVINGIIWSFREPYVERRLAQSKADLKARFEQQSFEDFHEEWMENMKGIVREGEIKSRGLKIVREE